MNIDAKWATWGLPYCMRALIPRTTPLQLLNLAEVGNTASADHLLQMATMPLEHKTTALGIPYSCPVAYQFDGAEALQQSLFSLFALLITGDAPRHCPSATVLGMKLCKAARTDSAHIMSVALSLAAALQTGRSTLAVAGVFGEAAIPYLSSGLASSDDQPQDWSCPQRKPSWACHYQALRFVSLGRRTSQILCKGCRARRKHGQCSQHQV